MALWFCPGRAAAGTVRPPCLGYFKPVVAAVLTADDDRAYEAGLICAGDGLTVEMLRGLIAAAANGLDDEVYLAAPALPAALRERIEGQQ